MSPSQTLTIFTEGAERCVTPELRVRIAEVSAAGVALIEQSGLKLSRIFVSLDVDPDAATGAVSFLIDFVVPASDVAQRARLIDELAELDWPSELMAIVTC